MEELLQQIEAYRNEIEQSQVQDTDALETFRIKWLGTRGVIKNADGGDEKCSGRQEAGIWPGNEWT